MAKTISKTKESQDVRLCIFSTMRTKDLARVPGVPLKEATDFGDKFGQVVLLHFHKSFSDRPLKENVRVITIPSLEPKNPFRFALSILLSYVVSIPTLIMIQRKYNINLFRADDVVISGLPCVIVAKILNITTITSLLGDVEEVVTYKIGRAKTRQNALALSLIKRIEHFVISNSRTCISVNKKLVEMAKSYGATRTALTYSNIDLSMFSTVNSDTEKEPEFTVLFVGRLEPEKGPLNVLKVAERLPDVKFLVAGYGSLHGQMEETIHRKRLINVRLLGTVSHGSLPKLYRSVHVLLLPSYSEGLPIVMLEAMASELPVIVSDVGAVGEILEDGKGGFCVRVEDIDSIARIIDMLRRDEKSRYALGKIAKANVCSRFSDFINVHTAIYQEALLNHSNFSHAIAASAPPVTKGEPHASAH